MHKLVVPLALAGFQVDCDDALCEQIVAGMMAVIVVAGGHFDRQIRHAELFIDADLRPHARVAREIRRIVEPGFVAELVGLRNGVEDPKTLAGFDVETSDVALLHVRFASSACRPRGGRPRMITVFARATIGVACSPTSPVTRSIC